MSNLIILPNSTVFEGSLADRVLMLNTEKAPKFQCYGFVVTRNSPIQAVPKFAQEEPLRRALAAGILTDVTGTDSAAGNLGKVVSDIDKAIKSKTLSPVKEGEEIGPRVMMGTDSKGNAYVITPKDQQDYERMQDEIRTTGHLRIEKPKPTARPSDAIMTGLSSIYMEDLPVLPPTGD